MTTKLYPQTDAEWREERTMDKAIVDLLEALEFTRSQDAGSLHMDHVYGEWTEDTLGAMIDAAVAAFRSDEEYQRKWTNLRNALR